MNDTTKIAANLIKVYGLTANSTMGQIRAAADTPIYLEEIQRKRVVTSIVKQVTR